MERLKTLARETSELKNKRIAIGSSAKNNNVEDMGMVKKRQISDNLRCRQAVQAIKILYC